MEELTITGVGTTTDGIYVEFSDGSSRILTIDQVRSLQPQQEARPEDKEAVGETSANRDRLTQH